jgi:hypothetical protein
MIKRMKCRPGSPTFQWTDQRIYTSMRDCPFCPDQVKERIVEELETVYVIEDGNPVTAAHLLVIPKRHVADYFDLTQSEQ